MSHTDVTRESDVHVTVSEHDRDGPTPDLDEYAPEPGNYMVNFTIIFYLVTFYEYRYKYKLPDRY